MTLLGPTILVSVCITLNVLHLDLLNTFTMILAPLQNTMQDASAVPWVALNGTDNCDTNLCPVRRTELAARIVNFPAKAKLV